MTNRSEHSSWFERWVARPTPVLAWAVALLLGGAWMATQVPLEWVPTTNLPEVRVTASWPGSSPRAVERYVTAPIERTVQDVEGIAGIESVSREGRSTVTLKVAEGTDLGPFTARVSERLRLLEETLPDRVTPRLTKRVPEELRDQQGFMTLQLVGPQEPSALRRLAEDQVSPRLSSLAGVADVRVQGGTTRELRAAPRASCSSRSTPTASRPRTSRPERPAAPSGTPPRTPSTAAFARRDARPSSSPPPRIRSSGCARWW